VTLQRWTAAGPVHAFVVKFKPASSPATVDVAMPTTALPGTAHVSTMAAANGAMAAINGDFGDGRPLHMTAVDAKLWESGLQHGSSFAVRQDEQATYVGPAKPNINVSGPTGAFHLAAWNSGDPTGSEVVGYSPEGGSVEGPPDRSCGVRLRPSGGLFWTAGQKGIAQRYVVDDKRCKRSGAVGEQAGMIVLATRHSLTNTSRSFIKDMTVGQTGITVKWALQGMPGVTDVIGGDPMLLQRGTVVAPAPGQCHSKYLCGKNPRVGVGTDGNGTVYYAVVDGRQSTWSVGLYLDDFAAFFQKLGATNAMNLDGGGSTTMWVAAKSDYCHDSTSVSSGCLVNHVQSGPGNTTERSVESSL
jgi:Phosphodiester glycosidase